MYGGTQLRSCLVPVSTMPASIRSAIPSPIAPEWTPRPCLRPSALGHRLENRAEAKLDRRVVGDQAGDGVGDGAVDRPRRPRRPSLRESFICLSPPGPVTIPRYAPFPVRGSVLYSSIFRKFSSSSLAYSAKFSWIRRRRREIFGNGSNFDQE